MMPVIVHKIYRCILPVLFFIMNMKVVEQDAIVLKNCEPTIGVDVNYIKIVSIKIVCNEFE